MSMTWTQTHNPMCRCGFLCCGVLQLDLLNHTLRCNLQKNISIYTRSLSPFEVNEAPSSPLKELPCSPSFGCFRRSSQVFRDELKHAVPAHPSKEMEQCFITTSFSRAIHRFSFWWNQLLATRNWLHPHSSSNPRSPRLGVDFSQIRRSGHPPNVFVFSQPLFQNLQRRLSSLGTIGWPRRHKGTQIQSRTWVGGKRRSERTSQWQLAYPMTRNP